LNGPPADSVLDGRSPDPANAKYYCMNKQSVIDKVN
jgi:hypothetical protein